MQEFMVRKPKILKIIASCSLPWKQQILRVMNRKVRHGLMPDRNVITARLRVWLVSGLKDSDCSRVSVFRTNKRLLSLFSLVFYIHFQCQYLFITFSRLDFFHVHYFFMYKDGNKNVYILWLINFLYFSLVEFALINIS